MIQSKLEDYVIHTSIDEDESQTFTTWWKSVAKTEQVEVKFPYHRHGLSGRISNHAKLDVMADFLEFVDANSQPTGRCSDSYSDQLFFLSPSSLELHHLDQERKIMSSKHIHL